MGLEFKRDFYTNNDYRGDIQNTARLHLEEIPVGQKFADIFPEYEIKDNAERVALAALASIAEMENEEMLGKDNAYREDYVDRVAEIIRQGNQQLAYGNIHYEQPAIDPKNIIHNTDYGDEHVLRLDNGNEIRTPPYPIPCDYVRVVRNGREVAYWQMDEWKEQPAEIMGAIMGGANTDEDPVYGQAVVDEEDDRPKTAGEVEDQRISDLNYELRHFQSIADRWGNKPGLTQLEACHGAIREAYGVRFSGVVPIAQPVGEFNPNRVYDALYDMTYADQIKERTMRAAKDLFGE